MAQVPAVLPTLAAARVAALVPVAAEALGAVVKVSRPKATAAAAAPAIRRRTWVSFKALLPERGTRMRRRCFRGFGVYFVAERHGRRYGGNVAVRILRRRRIVPVASRYGGLRACPRITEGGVLRDPRAPCATEIAGGQPRSG
ncbi:hypothetical protein GCM10010193_52440 [Kitasatospora atroaurantiaca]